MCARWRLSTALFRGMPDRFPFSVPGGLFVRRPSFPFRFRPSLPCLFFRIVVSLVFGQPVGAPSFPCLPCFHLNIYEVFSCVASCASSVLSLCVPSVPVSSPFCNPCRPLHVLRSNSFRCSIASSMLSLCVPLFLCFLLFAILAAPSIFPFQFVPLLRCVFHAFLVVRPLSGCIRLSCLGTSSSFTAFAHPFYLSFVYAS